MYQNRSNTIIIIQCHNIIIISLKPLMPSVSHTMIICHPMLLLYVNIRVASSPGPSLGGRRFGTAGDEASKEGKSVCSESRNGPAFVILRSYNFPNVLTLKN